MKQLKEEYEVLRKKYTLPSYKELDNEFELLYFSSILEISFPLKFVRRRMVDKVHGFISLLQNILYPNTASLISLEESKFFNEQEKNEVTLLIKELVVLDRRSLLLDLENNEKKDAEFIKTFFFEWKEINKKLLVFSRKLEHGWKQGVKDEDEEPYFG